MLNTPSYIASPEANLWFFALAVLLATILPANTYASQQYTQPSGQIAQHFPSDLLITQIHQGEFTWVAFSSHDYVEALTTQRTFRERGYTGSIIKADVDNQSYFRVVFGQYPSRKEAGTARKKLNDALPIDAWMLALKSDFELMPQSDWLPIHVAVHQTNQPEAQLILDPSDESTPESVKRPAVDIAVTEADKVEFNTVVDISTTPFSPDSNDTEEARSAASSPGNFFTRHIEAALQFSNIYEDNIEHDIAVESVQSYGMVPSLHVRFKSSPSDPLFTLDYLVARHSYSNTERWDRISNAFRGAIEREFSDIFASTSSVELSLKGSSEDRDVSNQFQIMQEVEFSFSRRHHLQLYGTYRVKQIPGVVDSKTFKPNVGINFERAYSDGERFESGARYEFNKAIDPDGNYKRWTFSVEYRTPEFNDRDQFEIGMKHRRKFYTRRFIEIDDEDYLRQDNRFSIQAVWVHQFKGGVGLEMGYEFETRGSNDPDKLYDANAFSLVMIYEL